MGCASCPVTSLTCKYPTIQWRVSKERGNEIFSLRIIAHFNQHIVVVVKLKIVSVYPCWNVSM